MKTLLAVVLPVLTLSSLASARAWNHDPTSPIGPPHWDNVAPSDATCGDSITGEVVRNCPSHLRQPLLVL